MSDFTKENQESQNDVPEYVQEAYREFQWSNMGGRPEQGTAPRDLNAVNSRGQTHQGSAPHNYSAANSVSQSEQGQGSRSFNATNTKEENEAYTQGDVPKARKKKWLPFAIGGGAIMVVAAVLLCIFLLPIGEKGSDKQWRKEWNGHDYMSSCMIEEDGTYRLFEADDEMLDYVWEPGGEYIVFRKYGKPGLYSKKVGTDVENLISDDEGIVDSTYILRNGIFYAKKDDYGDFISEWDYYHHKTGRTVKLADWDIEFYSDWDGEQNIVFINENRELMLFQTENCVMKKLGMVDSIENWFDLYVVNFSEDGSLVFLVSIKETAEGSYTLNYYCMDHGKLEKIGTIENNPYYDRKIYLNQTGEEAIVHTPGSGVLFYKKSGEAAEKIVVDTYEICDILTDKSEDDLDTRPESFDTFYCTTQNEAKDTRTLYCIDKNRDVKKVADSLYNYGDVKINNGIATFIVERESYNQLCYCHVDGDQIGATASVSEEVYEYRVSADGKYIYYMTDWDVDTSLADLYVYDTEKDLKEVVALDVNYHTVEISADGKTVVFLKDAEELYDDSFQYVGEGYIKRLDEDPVKIASDIVWLYPTVKEEYINEDMIPFMANVYMDGRGSLDDQLIIGGLYIYDGEDSVKVADDMIFNRFGL